MINRVAEYDEQTAKKSFDETATAIRSKLHLPHVDSFAREHPAAVMAIGALVGVAIGWWVKRK